MRPIRTVLYLRMSTDRQETSIPDQRKELAAHAKKHGYEIVGEYADEGISGDATEKRLAFQRMVADSGKKRFDLILCWDQDRFGRFDPLEGGYWIKPIRDAGVKLETLAQGRIDWSDFASRLVWTVTQEAKHSYLRGLSRDVVRGLKSAVESGVYPGVAPYGYRKKDKRLTLGPDSEVEAVQEIFRLKSIGWGHRTIAHRMENEGRPAPRGGRWTQGQIRYILNREAYTGITLYGKRRQGKYNRLDSAIRLDGTHEPIITKELFQQALTNRKPSTVSHRHGRATGALSGIMFCGLCGTLMYRFKYKNEYGYVCGKYHRAVGCGFCRVMEDDALAMVADVIREQIGDNIGQLAKRIERLSKSHSKSVDVVTIQKKIAKLDSQIATAVSRSLTIDEDLLPTANMRIRELRKARAELESQIANQPGAFIDSRKAAESLMRLPGMIMAASPEKARAMIHSAVESITVHFEQQQRACSRKFYTLKRLEITLRHAVQSGVAD